MLFIAYSSSKQPVERFSTASIHFHIRKGQAQPLCFNSALRESCLLHPRPGCYNCVATFREVVSKVRFHLFFTEVSSLLTTFGSHRTSSALQSYRHNTFNMSATTRQSALALILFFVSMFILWTSSKDGLERFLSEDDMHTPTELSRHIPVISQRS